jgi:hypothetical protein
MHRARCFGDGGVGRLGRTATGSPPETVRPLGGGVERDVMCQHYKWGWDAVPIVARWASREALWVFSLGSLHEPIAWLQGGIPLQHPPFATLTIVTTAVGNRQLGITHNVPCSAMRTSKADVMAKLAAHRCTICDSTPR